MARASEQFRQSDVTRWGIVALVCGALAVVSANVLTLLPPGVLSGLHGTRLGGMSVEQLRAEVTALKQQTVELQRENLQLANRFSLNEESGNEATRRIGALETSLPHLLEALADPPGIDRSLSTASTGAPRSEMLEAEGGTVEVARTPLEIPAPVADQPLPAPLASAPAIVVAGGQARFGIAIGPSVSLDQAAPTWDDLSRTLGPTILGLEPLLADEASSGRKRLVIGPTEDLAEANSLCARLERLSIPCQPMPYTGAPLAH